MRASSIDGARFTRSTRPRAAWTFPFIARYPEKFDGLVNTIQVTFVSLPTDRFR